MRVLSIVDSYRWALHNRAVALKKNLKQYDFDIVHFNELSNVKFEDYDVIYALNWPIWKYMAGKVARKRNYKIVTTVSSHIGRPNAKKMGSLFSNFDKISTSNGFLYKEFKEAFEDRVVNTPFGVDTDLFRKKTDPEKYRYIFGWVGNPDRPVKRYPIIKSALEELGPEYRLRVATNKTNYSRKEMVDFYNSIGTLICFSESEGTPNPVLEAAACGRAIISTPVGNVCELARSYHQVKVIKVAANLAAEIRNTRFAGSGRAVSKKWSWESRAKPFTGLFDV